MRPLAPPPNLPKDKEPTGEFDRWLYLFWQWVRTNASEGADNIIAVRSFLPPERPIPPVNDSQNILAGQIFGG